AEAVGGGGGVVVREVGWEGGVAAEGANAALRFFAGVPIWTTRAGAIGTLTVLDPEPRTSAGDALERLRDLAREAARQFDIRLGGQEVLSHVEPASGAPRRPAGALSESEYRHLVEQSPVGTYVIQDGRYRYVNPRLAEILGYDPAQLHGAEVAPLVVEPDRAAVLARLRGQLLAETPGPFTFRAVR